MSRWLLLTSLLTSTSFVAAARAAETLSPTAFHEQVDALERVSGAHLLGASFVGPGDRVSPESLHVFLPWAVRGKLELRVASVDARYVGSAEYVLMRPTKGWVRLDYPTRHASRLRGHRPERLAVRAELRGRPGVLLTRWGSAVPTREVVLFVNSERSETHAIAQDAAGRPTKKACRRIESGTTIKFDTVCSIPLASLPSDGQVHLQRRRGNSRLPQLVVRLGW
ncbi:MAG: hypothetical protein AAF533_19505 [Acidobacteriota bacterium]